MILSDLVHKIYRLRILIVLSILLVICIFVWSNYFLVRESNLQVKFYDVGQGDSIFIRTPNNYKILVDGGPNNKVVEYLNSDLGIGDRELDLVILTHPQMDHFYGLTETFKRFTIKKFLTTGLDHDTAQYKLFADTITNKGIKAEHVYEGNTITLSDGVTLKFIWPQTEKPTVTDLNDASIVLKLSYGNFDLLLTGDGDERIQPYPRPVGDIEVLKVPHHGSRTGLKDEFLKTLKPEISVISSGRNNRYGHPSDTVLKQLKDVNSQILRTDLNGTIKIVSDGEKWYTSTSR